MTLENVFTLRDLEHAKTIHMRALVRTDLDSTTDKQGNVLPNERLNQTSALALSLLQEYNIAKLLIWGHHKRPGEDAFSDLSQQAKIMGMRFVSFAGSKETEELPDRLAVLDNTRMISGEQERMIAPLHRRYASISDVYILDAPAVLHRKDTSIAGMHELMPVVLGPGIVSDLSNLDDAVKAAKQGPVLYLLGGMKINDLQGLIEKVVEDNEYENHICASGGLGLLALDIKGYYVGPSLDIVKKKLGDKYEEFRTALAKAMKKTNKNTEPIIRIPVDLVYDHNSSLVTIPVEKLRNPNHPYVQSYAPDIGHTTALLYASKLNGKTVVFKKGPDGLVEDDRFREGSTTILNALIDYTAQGGKSIIWGGEGGEAVTLCGLDRKGITHICMGGGASVKYFMHKMYNDKALPGLESAQKSFEMALNGAYDKNRLGFEWSIAAQR